MNVMRGLVLATVLAVSAAGGHAADASGERPIPFKKDPVSFEEQGWQVGVSLLVLLAAATGVLYLVRKRVPGAIRRPAPSDRVHLVDRLRVDGRTHVYVVRFRDREYVLAQSGEQIVELRATTGTPVQPDKEIEHDSR